MPILVIGLVVFLGVHLVRVVAPDFREQQIAANERRWKGVYTLISFAGLALIIWGWNVYRPEAPEIYEPPSWGRHLAALLVLLAFISFAASGPAGRIKHWIKHPMLTGTILWSVGHLLANGDLASLLLFGGFLVWAVVDLIAASQRGDPAPVAERPMSDVIAVVAGAALFAVFGLWVHGWLFGADPFV
jgi:uncharacterized membrane protein